jgi:hypothetical protein
MKLLFLMIACSAGLWRSPAFGQNEFEKLPEVFTLGEYGKAYEIEMLAHQTLLLQVCKTDMKSAHDKWTSMLLEMEAYAAQTNFDLKGTKLWLHIFWKNSGAISHIGFYTKPQSRNINADKLKDFFEGFMRFYQLPIISTSSFSHYGSASFPVYYQRTASSN